MDPVTLVKDLVARGGFNENREIVNPSVVDLNGDIYAVERHENGTLYLLRIFSA